MTLQDLRRSRPRRQRSLLSTSAPLALLIALGAGAAFADGLPVPDLPPPNPGTNWSGVAPAPGYNSLAATGDVNVTASRAYAEWTEFNIDSGNTLNINGQGADWILVNRVTGAGPSFLAGTLNANGQVWLINPEGVIATNTAIFNVGGLLFTTAQGFDRTNFLVPGSLQWDFTNAFGAIQMDGQVNAAHGVVALIGPQIGVGTSSLGTGGGTITETTPGAAQFVAIAATDVSLTFTDVGTVLQLDGVTINRGITSGGGATLDDTSVISVGRIFVATAGETAPSQILVSGILTATQARSDGQDIVLMATDNAGPSSPVVVAEHVVGQPNGQALESATTTTTGGDVILYSPITAFNALINSQDGVTVDPAAAPGASLFVRAAGGVQLFTLNNPAGGIDIQAQGLITDEIGPDLYVQAADDITLSDMTTDTTVPGDIAVVSSGGDVTMASADAGDDIVVRAAGTVTVTGDLTTFAHDSQINLNEQAGDVLASDDPITAYSVSGPGGLDGTTFFSLVGSDIDIKAGAIAIAGVTHAQGDGSDVRVQATGSIDLGDVIAEHDPSDPSPLIDALDEDILIDAGGNVSTGAMRADRDIAARAFGGLLVTGDADAGDDVVFRAAESVTTGELTTHDLDTDIPDQSGFLLVGADPMIAFSVSGPFASDGVTFDIEGADIDIKGASINVNGVAQANGGDSDARFQATGDITLETVIADRDILIDAGDTVVAGQLSAGRDIGARAFGGFLTIGAASAGDDLVLRAEDSITVEGFSGDPSSATLDATGLASSFDDSDITGAGDLLALQHRIDVNGFFPLTGSNVDVKSTFGAIDVGGVTTVGGPLGADARFQAGRAVTTGDVISENGDVLLDGTFVGKSAQVPLVPFSPTPSNNLSAGRDIVVRARTSAVNITSAQAGDDVAIRAALDVVVTGPLSAGLVGDALGVADQLVAPTGGTPMVVDSTVFEVLSGAGNSDVDVVAGLGPGGAITPTAAITVGGLTSASGTAADIRLQARGAIGVAAATAGEDILFDGSLTGIGQVGASGALTAGRDIGVRSIRGAVAITSAVAGDDIVLRSAADTTVTGALTANGFNDAVSAAQAGDLLVAANPLTAFGPGPTFSYDVAGGSDIDVKSGGALTVSGVSSASPVQPDISPPNTSDIRFQAPFAISLGGVRAGRDALIDSNAAIVVNTTLIAGRDVAIRSALSSITVTTPSPNGAIRAGDDIVLRSATGTSVTGQLITYDANDAVSPGQAGDVLAAHDPLSLAGQGFDVAGGADIDVKAGGDLLIGPNGPGAFGAVTGGTNSDVRLQAGGAITMASATASDDLLIDAGTDVTINTDLQAQRDVAVRSRQGAVSVRSVQAGDDIVLRAAKTVTASGQLTTLATGGAGPNQAGDLLAASDPILTYWAATADPYTPADGHDVDVRSGGAIALAGTATATGPASDIRLDSLGGTVSASTLRLSGGVGGEQVLVTGTDFALSGLIDAAKADVLLFSRAPSATLGGPASGLGPSFTFDNAEVSRTTAASLNVFSGVNAAQTGNLAVQDLQLTAALRTVRVYAGAGSRAEVFGQVTDTGGVNGVFEVGTAATDTQRPQFVQGATLRALATTWTPDVVRVSGGIGATGAAFSRVELAGQTIYIAPRNDTALSVDFEQAVAGTPPEFLPAYLGPATVQVRVGVLELRASNAILERNLLPTTAFFDGRGLELGALAIDRLTPGGPVATRVSLFGLLDSGLSGQVPPPAPGSLQGGTVPAFLLHFAPTPGAAVPYFPGAAIAVNYRFNGCAFGGQNCFALPNSAILPQLGFLSQWRLPQAQTKDLSPIVEDANDIGDVSDPFTSVDEDPVTNSGAEIEWSAPTLEQH